MVKGCFNQIEVPVSSKRDLKHGPLPRTEWATSAEAVNSLSGDEESKSCKERKGGL